MNSITVNNKVINNIKLIQFPKASVNPYTRIKDLPDKINFTYYNYSKDINSEIIKLPIGETYFGWYC